ncbi:hypothetical protein CDAR_116281 [Caerostris darwini]|uniref:Maturase K n=1 Tax=Caerostris darwini TaxID=1538125 RepID=A0AAV4WM27_9ARAC|nr:hypothetical protein CDAR_116281 [Caerostris darwini]
MFKLSVWSKSIQYLFDRFVYKGLYLNLILPHLSYLCHSEALTSSNNLMFSNEGLPLQHTSMFLSLIKIDLSVTLEVLNAAIGNCSGYQHTRTLSGIACTWLFKYQNDRKQIFIFLEFMAKACNF